MSDSAIIRIIMILQKSAAPLKETGQISALLGYPILEPLMILAWSGVPKLRMAALLLLRSLLPEMSASSRSELDMLGTKLGFWTPDITFVKGLLMHVGATLCAGFTNQTSCCAREASMDSLETASHQIQLLRKLFESGVCVDQIAGCISECSVSVDELMQQIALMDNGGDAPQNPDLQLLCGVLALIGGGEPVAPFPSSRVSIARGNSHEVGTVVAFAYPPKMPENITKEKQQAHTKRWRGLSEYGDALVVLLDSRETNKAEVCRRTDVALRADPLPPALYKSLAGQDAVTDLVTKVLQAPRPAPPPVYLPKTVEQDEEKVGS